MKPPEEGERQSPQPKEGSQAPYTTAQSARWGLWKNFATNLAAKMAASMLETS